MKKTFLGVFSVALLGFSALAIADTLWFNNSFSVQKGLSAYQAKKLSINKCKNGFAHYGMNNEGRLCAYYSTGTYKSHMYRSDLGYLNLACNPTSTTKLACY